MSPLYDTWFCSTKNNWGQGREGRRITRICRNEKMRRDCMKTWKDAVESVWNGQKMGRKDKDEREEGSRCRGVDERHRQQQHWGLHSTSCWHCWTEKQITHLIFALILVPVSSSQLVPPAYWDTWHVDHPLLYSPLLSHTSYLSGIPLPCLCNSSIIGWDQECPPMRR